MEIHRFALWLSIGRNGERTKAPLPMIYGGFEPICRVVWSSLNGFQFYRYLSFILKIRIKIVPNSHFWFLWTIVGKHLKGSVPWKYPILCELTLRWSMSKTKHFNRKSKITFFIWNISKFLYIFYSLKETEISVIA